MWELSDLTPPNLATKLYPWVEKQRFEHIKAEVIHLILYLHVPKKTQEIRSSAYWQHIQTLLLNQESVNRTLGIQLLDSQFETAIGTSLQKILNGSKYENFQKMLIQVAEVMKTEVHSLEQLALLEEELQGVSEALKNATETRKIKELRKKKESLQDEKRFVEYELSNTHDPVYDNAMVIGLAVLAIANNILKKSLA